MEPEWLSYQEVANRLGVTPEAARSRAKRLGWRRQMGNDGRALVLAALEPRPPGDRPVTGPSPGGRKAVDPALLIALEGHVATLKAELEHRDAEIDTLKAELGTRNSELVAANTRASEESAKTAQAIAAFEAHNATLKADVDKLEGLLGGERERADRSIRAFEQLAERLEAMAAAKRPPPWWRWLRGAG
jgi:hypothetical protein